MNARRANFSGFIRQAELPFIVSDSARRFRESAALFVCMLDAWQDRVLVTELSEPDYRRASFLDQRILTGRQQWWVPWTELAAQPISASPAHLIFHIGHVGSTLISRLLGELPCFLSVREPLILRAFAELDRLRGEPESPWPPDDHESRLSVAMEWLSRSFHPDQRALVKATSFTSEIAGEVGRNGRKLLFLYAKPDIYMQTILAGEASVQELHALSGSRLARLHNRLGEKSWCLWELSLGERAAMAWACEMTALEVAASGLENADILWLDFEAFLASPEQLLVQIASHFGHALDLMDASALTSGPIMSAYSKAPEHEYSPALRRAVLAQAAAQHPGELDSGRKWLEQAAARHPLLARVVSRAEGSHSFDVQTH